MSYLSSSLHEGIINCKDFDSVLDVSAESVCEMYSAIKIAHCDCLEAYLEKRGNRKSIRLIKIKLIWLSKMYPLGFRDFLTLLKQGFSIDQICVKVKWQN